MSRDPNLTLPFRAAGALKEAIGGGRPWGKQGGSVARPLGWATELGPKCMWSSVPPGKVCRRRTRYGCCGSRNARRNFESCSSGCRTTTRAACQASRALPMTTTTGRPRLSGRVSERAGAGREGVGRLCMSERGGGAGREGGAAVHGLCMSERGQAGRGGPVYGHLPSPGFRGPNCWTLEVS